MHPSLCTYVCGGLLLLKLGQLDRGCLYGCRVSRGTEQGGGTFVPALCVRLLSTTALLPSPPPLPPSGKAPAAGLPSVPAGKVPAAPQKTQEELELEALQAEMAL